MCEGNEINESPQRRKKNVIVSKMSFPCLTRNKFALIEIGPDSPKTPVAGK